MIYTENYQLRKPVIGRDNADVKDINYNSDRLDELIHSTQISLAEAYDPIEIYKKDDVVMYEMLMYKCLEDNVTGVWDAEKWERTTASVNGGSGDSGDSGKSIEFSTNEFDTGMKWTNGKVIYGRVINSMIKYDAGNYGIDLWESGLTLVVGYGGTVVFNNSVNPVEFNNGSERMHLNYNYYMGRLEYKGNVDYTSINLIVFYIK